MKLLPNCITSLRILIAPFIVLAADFQEWRLASLLILVAFTTDWLDGFLAIKLNAQSKLGSQLDGIADFLTATSGLLGLVVGRVLPFGGLILLAALALGLALIQGVIAWDRKERTIQFAQNRVDGFLSFYAVALGIGMVGTYFIEALGRQVFWLIPVALPIGAIAARVKRHRLKAWLLNIRQCLANQG